MSSRLPDLDGPFPRGSKVRCLLPVGSVVLTGMVVGRVLADVDLPARARLELPLWRVAMDNVWISESRPDVFVGVSAPVEDGPWEHAIVRLGLDQIERIS